MTTPDVSVMATEYTVCALPPEHPDRPLYEITVAYRGAGKWAVVRRHYCLSASGEWGFEPSPGSREDDWLLTHRFDLDTALALAKREAPKVRVNGHSVADALSWTDTDR